MQKNILTKEHIFQFEYPKQRTFNRQNTDGSNDDIRLYGYTSYLPTLIYLYVRVQYSNVLVTVKAVYVLAGIQKVVATRVHQSEC